MIRLRTTLLQREGPISGDTNIDIESTLEQMRASMETMGSGERLGLSIETLRISLCLKIMSILITVRCV